MPNETKFIILVGGNNSFRLHLDERIWRIHLKFIIINLGKYLCRKTYWLLTYFGPFKHKNYGKRCIFVL